MDKTLEKHRKVHMENTTENLKKVIELNAEIEKHLETIKNMVKEREKLQNLLE